VTKYATPIRNTVRADQLPNRLADIVQNEFCCVAI
jgi:hypothetical protein